MFVISFLDILVILVLLIAVGEVYGSRVNIKKVHPPQITEIPPTTKTEKWEAGSIKKTDQTKETNPTLENYITFSEIKVHPPIQGHVDIRMKEDPVIPPIQGHVDIRMKEDPVITEDIISKIEHEYKSTSIHAFKQFLKNMQTEVLSLIEEYKAPLEDRDKTLQEEPDATKKKRKIYDIFWSVLAVDNKYEDELNLKEKLEKKGYNPIVEITDTIKRNINAVLSKVDSLDELDNLLNNAKKTILEVIENYDETNKSQKNLVHDNDDRATEKQEMLENALRLLDEAKKLYRDNEHSSALSEMLKDVIKKFQKYDTDNKFNEELEEAYNIQRKIQRDYLI